MSQIFIHPGFGKTGTTSLQNHFFAKHPEIFSIGRPWRNENIKFCSNLVKNIGFYCESETQAALDALLPQKHEGPIVLSNETIVNSIFKNQIIVPRLNHFFPNAKIFFTIRNQLTAIPSFYANHGRILKRVPSPYDGKHITFDNWFDHSVSHSENSFFGIIKYEPLINLFAEVFGKDSIKIFLFEEYTMDLNSFSKNLAHYFTLEHEDVYSSLVNKKSNKRNSGSTIAYNVFRERFLPNFHPTQYIPFGSQIRNKFSSFLKELGPKGPRF